MIRDILIWQWYWLLWSLLLHAFLRFYRPASWLQRLLLAGPVLTLIPLLMPESTIGGFTTVVMLPEINVAELVLVQGELKAPLWWMILPVVSSIMIALHLSRVVRIVRMRHRLPAERRASYTLIELNSDKPANAFTFGRWIFMPHSISDELRVCILEHEIVHVSRHHSIELGFALMWNALCWINPASWLMRCDLKRCHEFVADDVAIRRFRGETYLNALLSSSFGLRHIAAIVHPFNHVKLKTRIVMLNKKKAPRVLWMIPAFCLGILCLVQSCSPEEIEADITASQQSQDDSQTTSDVRDASFPGGMEALVAYVAENLHYPESAKAENVQGKVMVQFTVAKDGRVTNPTVVKSLNESCDAAALAVFEAMPDWETSENNGEAVATQMVLPIMFSMN